MKKFSKLIGFVVVFMVMMATMCSVSFATDVQYTENVIPIMTSNTAPSGVASASSVWNNQPHYQAWRAFNHSYSSNLDAWCSVKTTGWLEYEFLEAKCISKYTIVSRNPVVSIKELPKNWTFEGWDKQLNQWIVLDTRKNITDWVAGVRKEFTFTNSALYNKYRINITANAGYSSHVTIGELEMMEAITTTVIVPINLTATASNAKVDLVWDSVLNATSYNVKRAITSGGEYTTIATVNVTSGAITSYVDNTAKNGTPYYYVVTAVNASGESPNSNEVSATPQVLNQLKLVLEVNEEKQISISDELSDNTEMTWTSSDSTIATVDENGKVKALKPGNTVITCTSEDYTESINVLVVDLEYQLAVDLTIGDTCRLTVDDLENTTSVKWSSYDSNIATVSAKGKVTAISEGLTYIVANDKDGNEIGRIYIRVRQ